MSIKKILIYLWLVFILFQLQGCISFINSGYKGLMWRPWTSGLDRESIYDNGSVWHMPWNDIKEYDVRWVNYSEKMSVLTADDLNINVIISVVLRPDLNEIPQLDLEIGPRYYEKIVRPEFLTVSHSILAKYIHNELPEKSSQIETKILNELRKRVEEKHLEFDNVTLDHIVYSRAVTNAVDLKLAVKQKLEQKEFELGIAQKDAEIQRIDARGQRDAQKIINEGLTRRYLQFKSLEVQNKLSTSSNAKFYFVPLGKDGLPIIIDTKGK